MNIPSITNPHSSKMWTWWRHQMEIFSALLAICAGNSPGTTQRPVTWSFDIFFDLRLNKRLSKHSWGWRFETPSCPLWHHSNEWEPWLLFSNLNPLAYSAITLNCSFDVRWLLIQIVTFYYYLGNIFHNHNLWKDVHEIKFSTFLYHDSQTHGRSAE